MDPLIIHNGHITPLREAHFSPGQMGLLMGWGVFTTLRLYRGIPFAFERHWARMTRDASRLGMSIGKDMNAVSDAIIELAKANHRAEGIARVTFVKNTGGLWAEPADHPATDLVIFTRELVAWPAAHRLLLQPNGVFSAGPYAGTKVLSWVSNAGVLEKARAEGYDDALLLNEKGELAECTSANIFLVTRGKGLTPPLSSGCLPGVTREIVLEVAASAGFEIREQTLTSEHLASAEAVFVTSTTREVAAVASVSPSWEYSTAGPFTQALAQAFREYVQSYVKRSVGHSKTAPA